MFLKGHGLRTAKDFAGEVTMEGIDRTTGKGLVFGEEVAENFLIVVATVC